MAWDREASCLASSKKAADRKVPTGKGRARRSTDRDGRVDLEDPLGFLVLVAHPVGPMEADSPHLGLGNCYPEDQDICFANFHRVVLYQRDVGKTTVRRHYLYLKKYIYLVNKAC